MARSAMRILYITSCWPHDRAFGGQLRALQIGRALKKFGRPTLVVVGAHDVAPQARAMTADEFDIGREIKVRHANTDGLLGRARSLVRGNFTNIHGFVAELADESWLLEAHKNYDLIWFFKLRTANYFANASWRNSVVDIDDVPSTMEISRLQTEPTLGIRLKAYVRTLELRRHESQLWRRFDVLGVCSKADEAKLSKRAPVYVIPNGFARPSQPPVRKPITPPRIGFMGLYSYEPNMNGVQWFIAHCWEEIKRQVPGVRFRLVGQDSDGPLRPKDPAVDALGWVENPAEEIASWSLMIVPIRIGAGTRVKIADAFSRKCPVVSTRFGALGYDVQDRKELLLADDPKAFVTACVSLINDQERANRMAEASYSAFLEKWTWDAVAPKVWNAATHCLRHNYGRSQGKT
jgi:glycosyltransferase involved in cell wall biosynthesis